jgi:hypothetical protein
LVIDLAVVNSNQGRRQPQPQAQPQAQAQPPPTQRPRQQQQQQQRPASPDLLNSINPSDAAGTKASKDAAAANNNKSSRKQTASYPSRQPKTPEKKDCPRHADGHPPNKYTTRDLGNRRIVSLFFGSEILLFDSIVTYKLGNPDKRVDDAIDAFGK